MGLVITLVVVGVLVLAVVWAYNKLVRLRNRTDEAYAQIDVQLRRRYDLIPNLIETVKGYAAHERQTLEAVTNARNAAAGATGVAATAEANGVLSSALGRLFAVAEAYPDLKANTTFLNLMEQLTTTENQLGFARQFYNDSVRALNTAIETVPTNFVAGMAKATRREYFEVEDAAVREAPKVQF
ncbi:MAG: LemA family protein [Actinomycetota bacterium]|nr:LemA family protein [Actinomycetota bacterium]